MNVIALKLSNNLQDSRTWLDFYMETLRKFPEICWQHAVEFLVEVCIKKYCVLSYLFSWRPQPHLYARRSAKLMSEDILRVTLLKKRLSSPLVNAWTFPQTTSLGTYSCIYISFAGAFVYCTVL